MTQIEQTIKHIRCTASEDGPHVTSGDRRLSVLRDDVVQVAGSDPLTTLQFIPEGVANLSMT